jgi:8-oxo-dGTP diphosphatase
VEYERRTITQTIKVPTNTGRTVDEHTQAYLNRAMDVMDSMGIGMWPAAVTNPDAAGATEDEKPEAIRLTADVVLFGEFDGVAHVLLIERGDEPFKGLSAWPGGHADEGEDVKAAAYRELAEETGIHIGPQLKLVGAYQTPGRDPRGRYVTFAYTGRLGHRVEPTAGDDAAKAEWVRLDRVMSGDILLAFDHAEILRDALKVQPLYGA